MCLLAGHFDGHADALKRCAWHLLMQHVQGYTGSHWMLLLPLGGYSLRIIPPGGRQGNNQQNDDEKYKLTFLAISMAVGMCR
jgi:hypothetical protein